MNPVDRSLRRAVLGSAVGLSLAWLVAPIDVRAQAAGAPSGAAGAGGASPAAGAGGAGQTQLREFLTGTKAARGSFTQRTQRAGGGFETASGVFAFQRPGRFRWEVRKPYEQLMVGDSEKLYFHDKDLNQVTVRKLADSLGASPASILFGSNDLERNFTLKDDGSRDGLDWLNALPKNKDAGFDRILIGLRGGLPEAMEVRDAFGRTTHFAFSGFERNPKLEADMFRFVAPRGAYIVEQ